MNLPTYILEEVQGAGAVELELIVAATGEGYDYITQYIDVNTQTDEDRYGEELTSIYGNCEFGVNTRWLSCEFNIVPYNN